MNIRVKFISLCLSFVLALSIVGASAGMVLANQAPDPGKAEGSITKYYTETKTEITNDFSDNSKNGIRIWQGDITDGRLVVKPEKTFKIATKEMAGDIYGVLPTEITFKMAVYSGSAVIGIRNEDMTSKEDDSGLRIALGNDGITVYEAGGYRAETQIPEGISLAEEHTYTLKDNRSVIELYIDDVLAVSVTHLCLGTTNRIEGLGTSADTSMNAAGYAAIYSDSFDGYIDDFTYYVSETQYNAAGQTVDYTYWVASDDLGRTTPEHEETGDVREEKYVGVFYFICHIGGSWPVIDHTKLYLERGLGGLQEFLVKREQISYGNYWAEPYFGYYTDTDEWILRKHAQMLSDAGVDFIFVDVSNAETYPDAHTKLFETWYQIRQEGGNTPQICFLTGEMERVILNELKIFKRTVYSDENMERYKDLIFMWDGKPLIFGNLGTNLNDADKELIQQFTVRGCWAWVNKDGYWNWLTESPQYEGRDYQGNFEQMSVVMGHHATTSKGRSYTSANGQPNNGLKDYEFSSDSAKYGYCFDEQFKYAIEADPSVIMITGWNEWMAGNFPADEPTPFANTDDSMFFFVDQFNPEFSRDGEPMRIRDGVGFGDNYYYQMVNYIRLYKGTNAMEKGTGRKSIDIRAGLEQWADVLPEYTDTAGDTAPRSSLSYGEKYLYVNNTGRNDIVSAKIAQDAENIYFLVRTAHDIIPGDGENWMNLYIDADQSRDTGWEGYDFVLNRSREGGKMSVERFSNDGKTQSVGSAEYYISGDSLTVMLPKSAIDTAQEYISFDFKWTDNSGISGNVMEFMDVGDAAPNSRFNFRFVGDEKYVSSTQSAQTTSQIIIVIAAVVIAAAAAVVVVVVIRKKKKGKE